jgi:hypothetical protein
LKIDLELLSSKIISIGLTAPKEEKLKIEIEKLLSSFLESLNITVDPSYEYTFLSGERADALYGHVIIEYEPPGTIKSPARKNKAINQVKGYIKQAAGDELHKFFGIVLDGQQIIFVRFVQSKSCWDISKSFNIDIRSMGRLIAAISALKRKPLDAEFMIQDFGPNGPIASQFIKTLYYIPFNNPKSQILFEDWKRIFQQISSYKPKKIKGLEKNYGIKSKIDYQKLLFCIHTYYSVVMKLIAAEVVVLYGGGKFMHSFISRLVDAETAGKLKDEIDLLEGGILFQNLQFAENFLEVALKENLIHVGEKKTETAAYMALKNLIEPLQNWNFIEIEKSGTSNIVSLSKEGRNALKFLNP